MPVEFSERIRRIPFYPTADAYGVDPSVAMLASNETPFRPLPQVVEAAAHAVGGMNRYPDPGATVLRRALADATSVPANRIAVGNGSCDLLMAAGEALLEPGAELVHAWPSFSVYPHLEAASGARAIRVPLDDEHRHDLDAMLREITVATRMVIICNPNNPSSTALPIEEIAAFVKQVPKHVAVILDEAYIEFDLLQEPDESVELLERHPNVLLLRTFSKVYGLCGLRVGYALCGSDALKNALDQVRQPFSVNVAAQAAAVEALRHGDEIARRVEGTIAERLALVDGLRELGLAVADSQANFVWLDLWADRDGDAPRDDREVVAALAERGVIVRSGSALGRPGALRVTVGTAEENERFLAALAGLR